MAENIAVNRFRNGDTIHDTEVTYLDELKRLASNSKGWEYIFLEERNYGNLYSYSASTDLRGLAPDGWHIATKDEWNKLIEYLGGNKKAPKYLKSTDGWGKDHEGKSRNGTNQSGFNALPSGFLDEFGKNSHTGYSGFWWDHSGYISLNNNNIGFGGLSSRNNRDHSIKHKSIRCVKD